MSSEIRYTAYDPWAWLYNKSEAALACQRLLPSLEKLLFPQIPQGAKILDLCCGTGQLTQQLILRGYQVIGLDGSEQMLYYARENAPQAQFILGDARAFEFPATFDAVICTDSALNHLMSYGELKSVFSNVSKSLKNNGIFWFDLGLEKRYRNIPVNDGELENNYAWTVGETYDPIAKTGTFTITIFQPPQAHLNELQSASLSRRLKRLIYNSFLRFVNPASLLQLLEKDWQPSEITFAVKPYARSEVISALKEAEFTAVNVYNLQGKLASPKEENYACFMAGKTQPFAGFPALDSGENTKTQRHEGTHSLLN